MRTHCKITYEAIVGVSVAEHPPGTVRVDDDGQDAAGTCGPDDTSLDRASGAALDFDPFLVDLGFEDLRILNTINGCSPLCRGQLIEERRICCCVYELLRGQFQRKFSGRNAVIRIVRRRANRTSSGAVRPCPHNCSALPLHQIRGA